MEATFFKTPSELREWLQANHATARELIVGFYKKASGRGGITYPEALDQMLCFGWIDGVRKSLDGSSFTIRFTPRKPNSIWSNVNIKRVGELQEMGRMQPPGMEAFNKHREDKSGIYSFEQEKHELGSEYEAQFRANREAWEFFQAQPPGYRRTAIFWVVSARQEATRQRRLATLIEDSQHGRRLGQLTRNPSR